jgi:subtilisin-like proprotein convertase family protein
VTPTTGDGDAFLESGESGTLALTVRNVGDGTATGVSVRVSTDDSRATVTPSAQSYGDMPADTSKAKSFTLALAPSYPRGRPVTLTVRSTFAGRLSPTTATLVVRTGQPATTSTTFPYNGPPVPIPDADEAGASVHIAVPATFGYAAKLTFSVDGTTCTSPATVGIDHTYVSDLTGTLTSPAGRTATVFSHAGGSGDNMCRVVFDDAAADPFALATTTDAPFTGTWKPDEPLATLLTTPAGGAWTFTARDALPADTGSIRAVSLHLTGYVG